MLARMAAAYGSWIYKIIGVEGKPQSLGRNFGYGLHQAEIDYLVTNEWAYTAEDILFRRTKLGLYFDDDMTRELTVYLNDFRGNNANTASGETSD
jgi:glycerol-3-phosphate dehydrogenase